MKSEVIFREREYGYTHFRRNVKAPIVIIGHKGLHICALGRIFRTDLGFKVWLEHRS